MRTTTMFNRVTVSALAGLAVAASAATPGIAAADVTVPDTGGVDATEQGDVVVGTGFVKVAAIGTFTYDQTTLSSSQDIARMQGAPKYLCGGATSTSAVNQALGTISITGDVANPYDAQISEMVDEEPTHRLMTCTCGGNPAGGRAIVTADVKGIPVEYLLVNADVDAGANTLTFVSADGTSVSMPLTYVIGRHGVISNELNGEGVYGEGNQLWMARTPANYFLRDVVQIVVSTEDEVPAVPGQGVEHPNSPNAGVLTGTQV